MMEREVVRRRRWLTHDELLDLIGAANLIPGPNSTEVAIHIGYRRAGWRGLLVAGGCFILPAALLVSALGWAYVRFGRLPETAALLHGVKPVVVAIVVQAVVALARTAVKTPALAALGAAALAATALGAHELVVLFGAGAIACAGAAGRPARAGFAAPAALAGGAAAAPFGLLPLFAFFLKVGAVLFGSGYVLLAFLQRDLVERWGWLTRAQLLDAIAVGQVTPGPVFTTATFIGWMLAGPRGATVATVGIFLPAFVFVALSGPLVPRVRQSRAAGGFLDGVNVASLALIAVVTAQLGRTAIVDLPTAVLALASAGLLLATRLNATWLVAAGALVGLLLGAR